MLGYTLYGLQGTTVGESLVLHTNGGFSVMGRILLIRKKNISGQGDKT